eukprot:4133189-Pleurochrysis_carterae.AAC.1
MRVRTRAPSPSSDGVFGFLRPELGLAVRACICVREPGVGGSAPQKTRRGQSPARRVLSAYFLELAEQEGWCRRGGSGGGQARRANAERTGGGRKANRSKVSVSSKCEWRKHEAEAVG